MTSEKNIARLTFVNDPPLCIAASILIISCIFFLTLNVNSHWDFVLPLRLTKLVALLMVAYAIGVSTLLFQTLTNNPILSPYLLGFDSLYIFLQTLLVFILGGIGYTQLSLLGKFSLELLSMMLGSTLLFYILMRQGGRDLARMILIGVIFGILFSSLSSLLQRMIDPEEFAITQAYTFASFNTVNQNLLGIGSIILCISAFFIWRERYRLDVYMLGRDQAINLGIPYKQNLLWILLWIAILVATATAVVGPVSFFGLLVVALSNHFSHTMKHASRLPMVFCIAGILLVGGQTIFEHVLGMKAVLSVVVEFAGGLVFLWLVLKKK